MSITVNNIVASDYTAGSGERAIVFLHGWTALGVKPYIPMLERLSESFAVYAPDLPGFGGTPEPPEPWGINDYVSFVKAYVTERGIKNPVYAGHSNGGRLILHALGTGSLTCGKAVLFNSAGVKPKRGASYYAKVWSYKLGKRLLTPFPQLKAKLVKGRGSADYKSASPVMRGTFVRLVNSFVTPRLKHIGTSVLLFWGKSDTATPIGDARIMQSSIPDCGIIELSGDHWAFLNHIDLIANAIKFFLK